MHQFRTLCLSCVLLFASLWLDHLYAQNKKYYWQQEANYIMEVDMDVHTNRFTGKQRIRYKNNSPDFLHKAFFHLYLNAFQPGSAMDVRSRTIPDPDPRIGERIYHLKPDEIGYQKIKKLTLNNQPLHFEVNGTILEVDLPKPIRPGQSVTFMMEYEAQVPLQIRRNGRDNKEGIRYSMSQWYPKLCAYDENGWHANPYIGREFYGVWGNFDVKLTIDANYVVAASGVLQNAKQIGHGYAPAPKEKPQKHTWHFVANKVHDFVWAADPDYVHHTHTCADGLVLHTFFQPTDDNRSQWESLPMIIEEAITFINARFGKYPYPVYSFIQGGDGGMEYPMATLITGNRSLTSLVGVSIHELLHSWYQMVLGFDESHYYWMDEGFTDYVESLTMEHLKSKGLIPGDPAEFPFESNYNTYRKLVEQGIEEPLSTHADHFDYNSAYSVGAYIKGAVFLHQLEYVIGKPAFEKGMLDFFNSWKFKNPDVHDFIKVMEKASGLELDWYKEYMVYSTKYVDYSLDTVYAENEKTFAFVSRVGPMPMPVDVHVTLKDGRTIIYYLPLDIMRGEKKEVPDVQSQYKLLTDWDWVNPYVEIEIPYTLSNIESIEIDATRRLADLNRTNNHWPGVQP